MTHSTKTISPLRQRMIDDMTLRKLSPQTQTAYVRIVKHFARFLGRSPDTASAEDLRQYQLHLVDQGISSGNLNATITGLKCFFETTLECPEAMAKMGHVHEPRKIPLVLSLEEVARLLQSAGSLKHQAALEPFHLFLIALAGWLNRQQQAGIDYLMEESRVLKEQLEGHRLRFTDEQRIRLAVKAKVLGRQVLDELETLVTPDTLLAWHRKLIAKKWTYARKGPGRPRVRQEITDLVLRMARVNISWGYDRIQGALDNLGHVVAPNTVKNILKRHGIEPAPERAKRTSWKTFLKAHWVVMAATDFFSVEVWTLRGLLTYHVLFVMRLKTRAVHIAGFTTTPNGAYMKQVARNLIDVSDGFLLDSRYLIMDRDTKYTEAFRGFLDREGVKPVRCPVRAPNCNVFAERFVRSIREECLDRTILFGEASLRRALREYVVHFRGERNHQGVGNRLLEPCATGNSTDGPIQCRERLGGMLNFYYREAA